MMQRMRRRAGMAWAAMALPVILGVGTATAQDQAKSGASADDKKFLSEIGEDSNFEIKTGQLALEKSKSADVKQYATMLIHDHTQLKQQIRSADTAAKVTPGSAGSMSVSDRTEYTKLSLLSGDTFDKAYIQGLLKGNEDIQKDEKAEAANSSISAVKSLAAHSAELDTKHSAKARQLAQAHGVQP